MGNDLIVIKMKLGIYLLKDKVNVNLVKVEGKDICFIIEVEIMLDDEDWLFVVMFVI